MQSRILQLLERIRSGYWFIPGCMVLGAGLLAELMLYLDQSELANGIPFATWFDAAGAEGSRAVLSAIAASMITVGATVFSITMLTLSSASQQFGPRMLRNFMRDRWNQFTLGTFTASFVYSLLVLRTARALEDDRFVPHLAVTVSMLLALFSVIVLIAFIHHVSVQIQAPSVIAMVARELNEQIDRFFPQEIGDEPEPPPRGESPPPGWESAAVPVAFTRAGYIEVIDDGAPLEIASEAGVVVRLLVRPGDFVVPGQHAALVWPAERVNDDLEEELLDTIALASRRTPAQDPLFAVRQLTEIAARALSPGLNDPYTAAACAEHLGAAMVKLARRIVPSSCRAGEDGAIRLIVPGPDFPEMLRTAFAPLRRYGASHPIVIEALVDALTKTAAATSRAANRAAVLGQFDALRDAVARALADDSDLAPVLERIDAARRDAALSTRPTPEAHPC